MGACECLQTSGDDVLRLRDCLSLAQATADDRLNSRKQVLGAMLQFTHQQLLVALRFGQLLLRISQGVEKCISLLKTGAGKRKWFTMAKCRSGLGSDRQRCRDLPREKQ